MSLSYPGLSLCCTPVSDSKGQKSMKSTQYYQGLQARCTIGIEAEVLESWEEGMLWTENVNFG